MRGPSQPTGLCLPAKPLQQQPLSPPASLTQNSLWLFTELIHRPRSSPDPRTVLPLKLGHCFLPGSGARSLMSGFCRRPPANREKFQKARSQKGRPSIFFPWYHIKYQHGCPPMPPPPPRAARRPPQLALSTLQLAVATCTSSCVSWVFNSKHCLSKLPALLRSLCNTVLMAAVIVR